MGTCLPWPKEEDILNDQTLLESWVCPASPTRILAIQWGPFPIISMFRNQRLDVGSRNTSGTNSISWEESSSCPIRPRRIVWSSQNACSTNSSTPKNQIYSGSFQMRKTLSKIKKWTGRMTDGFVPASLLCTPSCHHLWCYWGSQAMRTISICPHYSPARYSSQDGSLHQDNGVNCQALNEETCSRQAVCVPARFCSLWNSLHDLRVDDWTFSWLTFDLLILPV